MPVKIGQTAPDFTLYNTEKHQVSLSDFRGKTVVLLFFPFAFSSICTREMCEFGDNFSGYRDMNAEVVAVSVDSLYANKKFKEVNQLPFTLLSDFNKEVSAKYDVLIESFAFDYRGVSKRASFVIAPDGKVVFAEVLASPGEYPDMVQLKQAVMNLNEYS